MYVLVYDDVCMQVFSSLCIYRCVYIYVERNGGLVSYLAVLARSALYWCHVELFVAGATCVRRIEGRVT